MLYVKCWPFCLGHDVLTEAANNLKTIYFIPKPS